jgi:hypothetical protein
MKIRKSAKAKSAKARQKRNADLTRTKILQAAISEFGERGFAAASTDDMAERCGVNKRMITSRTLTSFRFCRWRISTRPATSESRKSSQASGRP